MAVPLRTEHSPAVGRPTEASLSVSSAGPPPDKQPRVRPPAGNRNAIAWLLGVALPLAAVNVVGWPYYSAPLAERVRHPLHAMLRPSGTVGLAAGVAAVAIFAFLWLYPLRKRYRQLAFLGSVGRWLDVHIATALALPLLLAIHSTWRADGVIGLGLLAMFVVIASGVVGRYLYVRIPRTRAGVEIGREDVAARRRELLGQLAETTGLSVGDVEAALDLGEVDDGERRLHRVVGRLIANDLLRWRRSAELHRRWSRRAGTGQPLDRAALAEAMRLARQEMALQQQTRMLDATHRVFRFWHVAHRPFAVTALVAVVIHVAVAIAMGAVHF